MLKQLVCFLAVALSSASSFGQPVFGDDLKAIGGAKVSGQYQCGSSVGDSPDVSITYRLELASPDVSTITSLEIRGNAVDESDLLRVNAAISGDAIETVTVSCSTSQVRIILALYDSAASEKRYVIMHKRRDASLEISR